MTSVQPPVDAPVAPPPRLTTTVPREYVHRASLAEVFLTACTQQDGTRFELTGQWPRAHTFFQSADGREHDPLLVAETFRQTGLFLAHAELGVPLGHHFVMRDLTFAVQLHRLSVGLTPTDITLTAVCSEINRRGRTTSGFRMDLTLRRDGVVLATGGGQFTCVAPAVYRRLRGPVADRSTAEPSVRAHERSAAGRLGPSDVVLSSTARPNRWLLTPDPCHPVLFDHAGDHLPGMVLLEAARQAATRCHAVHPMRPAAISTTFDRYAELDSPCWIEVTPLPTRERAFAAVRVTGRQENREVFSSVVSGPRPSAVG